MTLSRKAIRPFQTAFLLAHNVLPVSIDYRLCPEISLIDGPIADTRDAYAWVQTGGLQAAVRSKGIAVDAKRIVVIGWSTGGHLAMTTAWTSKDAGLKPPVAILSFYGPTDFESGGESPSPPALSPCSVPHCGLWWALSNDASHLDKT
jgi:acetyl esterase/lipase